jgi:ribose transport system permease protein
MSATESSAPPSAYPGSEPGPGAMATPQRGESGGARALRYVEAYALPALFVVTLIFFSLWGKTHKTFPTTTNIQNVLGNQGWIGLLALAITVPLVCREFDFSVGPIAGLCQVFCAGFMARLGWPLPLVIVVVILIGALIGLSSGNTVARVGVNSLIVTLGVASILVGVVQWYTGGQSIINGISPTLISIGSSSFLGIPGPIYILAVVALLLWYLLEHTPYGRYLYSIGSNREAARLVGLPVPRYVMFTFVLSGTLSAIAGILLVARNGVGSPQVGTVFDTLGALSAAFLGSTAFKPGRFNVPGTLVAVFFLAFLINGFSLANVDNWISYIINGAVLFVAVLVSTVIGQKRAGTSH